MAILLVEQNGNLQAGTLQGRVLIGRWSDNTVVIEANAVSRIHAWVGIQNGQYYIADVGSRTGTFVNGKMLHERHILEDRDEIRIGPATLQYRTSIGLPEGIPEIDLSPRNPTELAGTKGVFMDCVCGAPLWVPSHFSGVGQCRYCGHEVAHNPPADVQPLLDAAEPQPAALTDETEKTPDIVEAETVEPVETQDDLEVAVSDSYAKYKAGPKPRRFVPPPAPTARPTARVPGPHVPSAPIGKAAGSVSAPATKSPQNGAATLKTAPRPKLEKEKVCGICHAPITVFDDVAGCPSCGLGFHADCWRENHGCSAYGCAQVGAVNEHG